jgi:hypothetical protein
LYTLPEPVCIFTFHYYYYYFAQTEIASLGLATRREIGPTISLLVFQHLTCLYVLYFLDLREIGWDGRDRIELAQDRDQWSALVNTVMNLRVP